MARDGPGLAAATRRAAECLRAGGIVVHPTSTLYGLGSRACRELDAELARLKGRAPHKPFVRLAPDGEAVRAAAAAGAWDERADRLARAFWPGPLTLVVDDGSAEGLAVRVDAHPVALALLAEAGELMTSTSVNRAGEPPAREPEEVRSALRAMPATARPAILLDAGPSPGEAPSTIVSLLERPARILRAGAVPVREIEACLEEGVNR